MASGRYHTASLLSLASVALLLVGCHVDLSGLNQLFSSDPTYLSLPGTRIATGKFSYVSIVGTDASGPYVAGFDSTDPQPLLNIFPFGGGKGCKTGLVTLKGTVYDPLDFGVRSTVPPILAFHEQTDNSTLLHLTTLGCKESLAPIVDGSYPIDATFTDPPGYLALDATGNLTFLEPWKARQTVVAPSTKSTRVYQDKIWSIEAGKLVIRDFTFKELAHYGTNVTEFDFTSSAVVRAVYVDATCAEGASPCGGDLYVVTDDLGPEKKIDSDACHVVFPARWGGFGVSYRSPCADRHLVVYGSEKASDPGPGKSDVRVEVGDSVVGSPDVDFLQGTAYVFYLKADDPTAKTGTMWGGVLGSALESIADNPTRDSRGAPVLDKAGTVWRVIVDYDSTVGRLVTWKPGADLTELATRVEQITSPLAIVNFDGTVGDLVHLSGATVSKPILHHVPAQRILVDDPGIAVIGNFDGKRGTLFVAPAGTVDFEEVATGIGVDELDDGSVAFLQSLNGIAYLHDFDDDSPATGVLGTRLLDTGDTFDIGIRATEWSEYGWPEPGLLYVSQDGDASGIWFARLR